MQMCLYSQSIKYSSWYLAFALLTFTSHFFFASPKTIWNSHRTIFIVFDYTSHLKTHSY